MRGKTLPSRLEEGAVTFPGANLLSTAWEALSAGALLRPIPIPRGARLITVGGATLGGSGKTPLAIALARAMSNEGEKVTLVGHAYGARPGRARVVMPDDDVREVGDEALIAARALEGMGAYVVVANERAKAVDLAATLARTLILDGPLQAKPIPAHRALLAVDSTRPWGSEICPPRGDLRAPRAALLSSCDTVVAIGKEAPPPLVAPNRPVLHVPSRLAKEGRLHDSKRVSLASLVTAKVGLLLGLARPARVIASLAAIDIHPRCALRFRDHALPSRRFFDEASKLAREARLDAWIATEKCATRLPNQVGNVPVISLAQELELSTSTLDFLGIA